MGNQNESVLKIILDEGTRPVVETLKGKLVGAYPADGLGTEI